MDTKAPIDNTQPLTIPIGCVVALNSHPFFKDQHKDIIYIAGEASMISPLMIVTEVLLERRASYDEASGFENSTKDTYQCKCIWFSLKSNSFEEAWLSSKLLKKIECLSDELENRQVSQGKTVVLKTGKIEIGKKKSSLSQFGHEDGKGNSITGLLSFCSPPMLIIGRAKSENKEPLIDPKNGLKKRAVSESLVKCKYFNPASDKLSEIVLPLEALAEVNDLSAEHLNNLEDSILQGTLFKIQSNFNTTYSFSLIKPLRIIHKGGFYFLESKDLMENRIVEVFIDGSKGQFAKTAKILETLPRFNEGRRGTLTINYIDGTNLKKLNTKNFWRIKYKDYHDKITTRTIYNPIFFTNKEPDSDGVQKIIHYIKANCILRKNEERYFRIDRITRLEVLDLDVKTTLKKN